MLIYYECWNCWAASYCFFETCDIFLGFFDEYKVKKNSIYLKNKFCVTIYNAIQKFVVSNFSFFLKKEINTFILEGCFE